MTTTIICSESGCGQDFPSQQLYDLHYRSAHIRRKIYISDSSTESSAAVKNLVSEEPSCSPKESSSKESSSKESSPEMKAEEMPPPAVPTSARKDRRQSDGQLANYVKIPILHKNIKFQNNHPQQMHELQQLQSQQLQHEYECLDCGSRFCNTSELRQHQKVQHHVKTYKCRKCGELFRSIADRQTHKNNKHFTTISCIVTGANFIEYKVGAEVTSTRNDEGYFNCPVTYCTFVTRIPGYWYDHIHHVEHNGVNPQKRKTKKQKVPSTIAEEHKPVQPQEQPEEQLEEQPEEPRTDETPVMSSSPTRPVRV